MSYIYGLYHLKQLRYNGCFPCQLCLTQFCFPSWQGKQPIQQYLKCFDFSKCNQKRVKFGNKAFVDNYVSLLTLRVELNSVLLFAAGGDSAHPRRSLFSQTAGKLRHFQPNMLCWLSTVILICESEGSKSKLKGKIAHFLGKFGTVRIILSFVLQEKCACLHFCAKTETFLIQNDAFSSFPLLHVERSSPSTGAFSQNIRQNTTALFSKTTYQWSPQCT